jgi:hypothetical protein
VAGGAGAPSEESATVGDKALLGKGGLRAGSVDDNETYLDYLDYRKKALASGLVVHDRDVSQRLVVNVVRVDDSPVLGAEVALLKAGRVVQTARTRADGRALLFPAAAGAMEGRTQLRVSAGTASETTDVDSKKRAYRVVVDAPPRSGPAQLDVHFIVDTTGSMEDEIDRLRRTMQKVSDRIATLPQHPDVRFGLTVYRDHNDAYVSRTVDFTGNLPTFLKELQRVRAGGGGDTPEDLNLGLHNAIHGPEWRSGSAVQLAFLIADAPPHLDYAGEPDYAEDMFAAAAKGISITPIAASGLDDTGEFVFRQLAQVTQGRFDFLTYGPDGAPGDSTTHHVDRYAVTSLDDLIVDEVRRALAPLGPSGGQQ